MNATFLVCVPAQGAKEPVHRTEHEPLRIGRTRDGNDIGLPGDKTLSSHHCEFFFRDNAWHVRDLDTESGTFVDGERVQETALASGARVRLGVAEIVYTPDIEHEALTLEVMDDKLAPPEYTAVADPVPQDGLRPKVRLDLGGDVGPDEDVPIKITPSGSGRRGRVREIE